MVRYCIICVPVHGGALFKVFRDFSGFTLYCRRIYYIVLLRVRCVRGDVYTREIFKLLMDLYEMCSVWPEEMYLIYVLYT